VTGLARTAVHTKILHHHHSGSGSTG